jgi:hypothetical protein
VVCWARGSIEDVGVVLQFLEVLGFEFVYNGAGQVVAGLESGAFGKKLVAVSLLGSGLVEDDNVEILVLVGFFQLFGELGFVFGGAAAGAGLGEYGQGERAESKEDRRKKTMRHGCRMGGGYRSGIGLGGRQGNERILARECSVRQVGSVRLHGRCRRRSGRL